MVGIMRDLVLEDDPILKKRAVLFDFDNPQEDPEKLTEELMDAIFDFQSRERRFGKVSEQVANTI